MGENQLVNHSRNEVEPEDMKQLENREHHCENEVRRGEAIERMRREDNRIENMSREEDQSRNEKSDCKGTKENVANGLRPVTSRRLRDIVEHLSGLKEDIRRIVQQQNRGTNACEVGEEGEHHKDNGHGVVKKHLKCIRSRDFCP